MAMAVRYTVVDGEIIAEKRSGTRSLYVPDPHGSTIALLNSAQTITDIFSYWAYGINYHSLGSNPTAFIFLGTLGYYKDDVNRTYVRARVMDKVKARWITEDPIGFDGGDWNPYRYVANSPMTEVDTSGLSLSPCRQRTLAYCDKANCDKGQNRAENCFCRVSNIACNFIINTARWNSPAGKRLDCMNKCMFNNWKSRGGKFGKADQTCKMQGVSSDACCNATIAAEQNGFTICNTTVCKGVGKMPHIVFPFPLRGDETTRVRVGQQYCCKKWKLSPGNPLPPGYPRNLPGY
jgi:RHS repeat-associated protein